jgi:hypothetical protein
MERHRRSPAVLGLATAIPIAQQCGVVGIGNTEEVQTLLQVEILAEHTPIELFLALPPTALVGLRRSSRKHFNRAEEAKTIRAVRTILHV